MESEPGHAKITRHTGLLWGRADPAVPKRRIDPPRRDGMNVIEMS